MAAAVGPTTAELEAGLDHVRAAPVRSGRVVMIQRRPAVGERERLDLAELDPIVGLVGDSWIDRPSRHTPDGSPALVMQLNIMGSRAIELIAGTDDHDAWAPAGDLFFVDLDLSGANLPPGTRLTVGSAVVEVTDQPHTGCAKFTQRYGLDAMRFVNSPIGRELNLRGICARVLTAGTVRPGDRIAKVQAGSRPR